MALKNNISDFRIDNDKLFGIYRGVVEDRYDPEKLCRCKIRVLGVHDHLKDKDPIKGIPTEELPWAEPAYGLFQGSISGNGFWTVPLQGSYVFVFFEAGNIMQTRYFLTVPGLAIEPPNGKLGFYDPDEEWPDVDWLDEAETHRYAKRDFLGKTSLIKVKLPNIREDVPIALGGTWNEVPPMYEAEYPYNTVAHTWRGIYFEIDNTIKKERFHLYHPSNSYMEIDFEGRMTLRNNLDRWDITMESQYKEVVGEYHRLVRGNRTSLVLESEYREIDKSRYTLIVGDDVKKIEASRHTNILSSDFLSIASSRHKSVAASENNSIGATRGTLIGATDTLLVGASRSKFVGGTNSELVTNNESYSITKQDVGANGQITLRSNTAIYIEAPLIVFRGEVTNILTEATNIGGELTWNGVAYGKSEFTEIADEVGDTLEHSVTTEPRVPPSVPLYLPPTPPTSPDNPVPPPQPPAPPEYDYDDDPPKPDICKK